MKDLKSKFISFSSKALVVIAGLFAISLCAGKMYEPKLPEQLKK